MRERIHAIQRTAGDFAAETNKAVKALIDRLTALEGRVAILEPDEA